MDIAVVGTPEFTLGFQLANQFVQRDSLLLGVSLGGISCVFRIALRVLIVGILECLQMSSVPR